MNSHVRVFERIKIALCEENRSCTILAKALVWEARGEPLVGKEAIGYLILNRANNPKRWPDNIYDVIKQKNQFSFWKDMYKQSPPTKKDWEVGYTVAFNVINNIVENPIGLANHYHSIGVNPRWANKLEFVTQIGRHKFYK